MNFFVPRPSGARSIRRRRTLKHSDLPLLVGLAHEAELVLE